MEMKRKVGIRGEEGAWIYPCSKTLGGERGRKDEQKRQYLTKQESIVWRLCLWNENEEGRERAMRLKTIIQNTYVKRMKNGRCGTKTSDKGEESKRIFFCYCC